MAQWVHLSPPFGLSLSNSLCCWVSLSFSHVSTDQRIGLPSPPCSPTKRESPSCHHHCKRDGHGTQIGRDTLREGGGGGGRGKKMYSLLSSYPTVLRLSFILFFFSNLESLRLQSLGEETHIDIEFVTHDDSRWRHLRRDTTLIWRFM